MHAIRSRIGIALFTLTLAPALVAQQQPQQHQHPAGKRSAPSTSRRPATPAAQAEFNRAMTLLHSFEFGPAMEGYNAAAKADPSCAMAHWGIAIARWSNPFATGIRTPAQIQQGLAAITRPSRPGRKPTASGNTSPPAAKLYTDADKLDQRTRVVAYEQAMRDLAAKYPDDREASIFWALSLPLRRCPPTRPTRIS
jgi:hypothetical protein